MSRATRPLLGASSAGIRRRVRWPGAPCDNPWSRQAGSAAKSAEGSPIDIIFLVERLESLIANGKKLPLTNNVVVDQVAALDLIDQLRVAVPEEVRAAKRINSEGERIIEKAQEEAEQIIARAQEQAAFLIDERGLLQAAAARRAGGSSTAPRPRPTRSAAAPTSTPSSVLIGLEGDVVQDAPEHQEGHRAARRATRSAPRAADEPTTPIDEDGAEDEVEEEDGGPSRSRARADRARGRGDAADLSTSRGLLARAARRGPRRITVAGVTIDLGDGPPSWPIRSRARVRLTPHEPWPARRRPTSTTASTPNAAAACATIEVPIELEIEEEALPSIDIAHRPAGSTAPAEPDALRLTGHHELELEPAGPRGDPARRADRAAVRGGLPGPVRRLRRSAATRPARARGRHRPAPRGPRALPGRRRRREPTRLPPSAQPVAAAAVARDRHGPRLPTGTTATKEPPATMGVPKRRVSHARQGERRAHLALAPAAARGVPALPRAEAAAPRLPELRLLRRPAGDRAQEDRRTKPPADRLSATA